jgi:hypothetical protein
LATVTFGGITTVGWFSLLLHPDNARSSNSSAAPAMKHFTFFGIRLNNPFTSAMSSKTAWLLFLFRQFLSV